MGDCSECDWWIPHMKTVGKCINRKVKRKVATLKDIDDRLQFDTSQHDLVTIHDFGCKFFEEMSDENTKRNL